MGVVVKKYNHEAALVGKEDPQKQISEDGVVG